MTLRDWFPVITLVLGSMLTIVGGIWSESNRNRWASRKEREDRYVQRRLERLAFQRDTLLQLQDAGQDLMDYTSACFREKWPTTQEPIAAKDGSPASRPISSEAEHQRRRARLQTDKLLARVEDDGLRDLGQRLAGLSRSVVGIDSYEDAQHALNEMQEHFIEANYRLGSILRSLLQEDVELSKGTVV